MNTIEQEASSRKRRFSEEFKRDAVRLVAEQGITGSTFGAGTVFSRRVVRMLRSRNFAAKSLGSASSSSARSWSAKS